MKVLIAEDEINIGLQYKLALEHKNHEVILVEDGKKCLEAYFDALRNSGNSKNRGTHSEMPFDAVILDYSLPKKDGMDVALEIFKVIPQQRIIFASAYVVDTLIDSVRKLNQVVELLQKPFELDPFVDLIEDKGIYSELEVLNVKVKTIKDMNPSHDQVRDLLDGLKKIQKGRNL